MRVKRNPRKRLFFLGVLLVWAGLVLGAEAQGGSHVDVVRISGPVTPVMLSYISRGIEAAERDGAVALIIQLDTPGGSVKLTEDIVKAIRGSQVPVVVYVSPRGAWAASAGTLITLAGHAAAMAPDTSIGAASPVGAQGEELSETLQQKEKEILKASARSLAQRRGEQAVEWVALAVDEARAATAQEALEMGVIDIIAQDLDDLLRQLDGRSVEVAGQEIVLHTAGAAVVYIPMNLLEQFMHTITDPNIAFILMTIGINALIFELSSPGGYVAGIVGVVCLGLSLYALGVLSVDYTGLLFIVLAFVLFLLDVKAPTHGILTVGGIASFIFGSIMLFNSSPGTARVSLPLVIGMGLATGSFFAFAVTKAIQAQRRPAITGLEGLIGQTAQVRKALRPEGVVFIRGELWNAVSEDGRPIEEGRKVLITGAKGFQLRVRPWNQ